jgi:putative chitinase
MIMNLEQLQALGIDAKWLEPLNKTFEKYEINTPLRQAAFIGQCGHESNLFKTLEENLNYSAKGLMATWPSRFHEIDLAEKFERNPEMIANKVYGGRADLGNTEDGDGWKFHGRGLIQLTGRTNYTVCGLALGKPFAEHPELVLEPENAALSAGWFWNKRGLNSVADDQAWELLTKRINGGLNGLQDRIDKTHKAMDILGT